ncbi:MAG: NHL repeat-containing protein [Spirochaetia bacterium]|nr:NHL repeat-containing protein [Spirochaetia bacterium]
MIDLSLMSKQEKIIIFSLLGCLFLLGIFMSAPTNVKKERKAPAELQNILTDGGAPGTEKSYFQTPKDLAIDNDGNVYVVDSRNHRIQKFNNAGVFILSWGKEGTAPGDFKEPCGIDIGRDGTVYVADTWNGRIQTFNSGGSFVASLGQELGLWGPRDVGVDREGNVYALDTGNCVIYKMDRDGRMLSMWGKKGGGRKPLEFQEPFSIKQGPDGNMYVLDRKNYRIQVITTAGKFVREFPVKAWSDKQVNDNGCLMEPYLDIDMSKNTLYVTDSTNRRVLRYSMTGTLQKTYTEDVKKMKLQCPMGVAVFINGLVLATDTSTGKIVTLQE